MKIVAIVPIKLNNTRLPNKNIKSFTNGKPLVNYIINTLINIQKIDEIYIFCSNEDIKKYIENLSKIKFLKRSEDLDKDTTKMNEVLKSFAENVDSDIYMMTHATAPFISEESINKGLDAVISGEYDSSFSAKVLQDFLWENNKPFNYSLDSIPRTQDLPKLYKETSGFYIYRKEVIKKYNRRIGNNPYIVEVDEIESVDIDEFEDFIIADAIYNLKKNRGQDE